MRLRRGLFVVVVALVALCVALVGCNGSSASSDPNENFVGTWAVTDTSEGEGSQGGQELELAKSLGIYLTLENGGKANYELFGHTVDGTWTASDATHATLKIEEKDAGGVSLGQETNLAYKDGKISMEASQGEILLMRIDPSEKKSAELEKQISDLGGPISAEQAGNEMGNSANVSGYAVLKDARPLDITIADDAVCTIKAISLGDYYGNPAYVIKVTNKTDKPIMADNDGEFTVNGRVGGVNFSTIVPAQESSEETLWFENIDTEDDGVDSVANVSGRIVVTNSDTGDKLGVYEFSA